MTSVPAIATPTVVTPTVATPTVATANTSTTVFVATNTIIYSVDHDVRLSTPQYVFPLKSDAHR